LGIDSVEITPPEFHQFEVTVFGKGVGECIVVHLGANKWMIVDSFLTGNKMPVAIEYLNRLGVDAESVVLVVATHWDTDHIRGISTILEICPNAKFVCSQCVGQKDFMSMAEAYNAGFPTKVGSGTAEIVKIFKSLRVSRRSVCRGAADKLVYKFHENKAECRVWCLSPTDGQLDKFWQSITKSLQPRKDDTQSVAPKIKPNHSSVVTLVQWGAESVLLGADLEETNDPTTGWTPIVNSSLVTSNKSCIFKIPHHGSENGHSDAVWESLLVENPIAVVTPFEGGAKKLPSSSDIVRIKNQTSNAYLAKRKSSLRDAIGRTSAVRKMIKENTVSFTKSTHEYGFVTMRRFENLSSWNIALSDQASNLN
jgi:hypothetical protein